MRFLPSFAAASIYLFELPYHDVIGSVSSLSGHAVAYRWRSLPRVRRDRASKPQGGSERVLPWQVTMDRLICASLSHTHYWYKVDILKVHENCRLISAVFFTFKITEKNKNKKANEQKKQTSKTSFLPSKKITAQPLFGMRRVSPSSAGIELPGFLVVQFYLSLLPAHRQNHNLLASSDLWSCFLGFHPDNSLKNEDSPQLRATVGGCKTIGSSSLRLSA